MTNQEAIEQLKLNNPFMGGKDRELFSQAIDKGIEALENQKALGEEMRKFREGINDEKVLFGFNMAIAICNKYLGE